MQAADGFWPVRGLVHFLAHPRLWVAPIAATVGAWLVILLVAGGALWATWPADLGWSCGAVGSLLIALGWGLVAGIVAVVVVLPLLIGLAYEALVRRVLRAAGTVLVDEAPLAAIASAGRVLLRMLPWVAAYPLLSLACNLTGVLAPLGFVIAHLGLAHLSVLEAGDLCLAARGLDGRRRWAELRARSGAIGASVAVGTLLAMLLNLTLVGGVLILPAIFVGTALQTAGWRIDAPANRLPARGDTES